jgi:hypothetical protein
VTFLEGGMVRISGAKGIEEEEEEGRKEGRKEVVKYHVSSKLRA